jgi:hypothetical protein
MDFVTIPLAALLIGQSSIRALAPVVHSSEIARSEPPPVPALQHGGTPLVLIALIRVGPLPPPKPDPGPSYLGLVGIDAGGRPLDGMHRYLLHFTKDDLPPAGTLWSLTALENDPFRSSTLAEGGMLGRRDDLHYNSDSSLDVYLQREPPAAARHRNWLRAPSGPFNILAHVRWQSATSAKNGWQLPSVKRLD